MSSLGMDTTTVLESAPAEQTYPAAYIPEKQSASARSHKALLYMEAVADGLSAAIAVVLGYEFYKFFHIGKNAEYSAATIWGIALALGVLFVILLDRDGAYAPGSSLLRIKETERSLRVTAETFVCALPVTFFSQYTFSRWVYVFALFCVPIFQLIQKHFFISCIYALRAKMIGVDRVMIYGAGFTGKRVFSALVRSPQLGLLPVAILDDDAGLEGEKVYASGYRREHALTIEYGDLNLERLKSSGCDLLIIAIPSLSREKINALYEAATKAGVRIAFVSPQGSESEFWTECANVDGVQLNLVTRPHSKWQYEIAKRAFDSFCAIVIACLFSPVLICVAILVRLDSPGPIFFKQERVGKNGKLFWIYKFRSMYVNAPKYTYSPKESVDPRITPIGRFLRRTSLDELPQLINVLKGEMSLVGPRPEMPFIVDSYNAQQRQRLSVVPGITGLWQLSADRAYLIHENIQYDLYYIRHRSIFMDIAILLHTVAFAMKGV